MKRLVFASVVAALALSAHANIIFSGGAILSGNQEVPPNDSPATGTAQVTVDDGNDLDPNSNLLSWDVIFSGLEDDFAAAHFHRGGPGVDGPIAVPIGTSPPLPAVTANELIGFDNISAVDFGELAAGLWYINIHSLKYPGGEIRGQVIGTTVPEPSSMALLGLAILGLAGLRRQRVLPLHWPRLPRI